MSPHCVWIITAGGFDVDNPNVVMLTELGQCSVYV